MADKSTEKEDCNKTASNGVKADCGCPGYQFLARFAWRGAVLANGIKCGCDQTCVSVGIGDRRDSAKAGTFCFDTPKSGKTCSAGNCECSDDCICSKY